MMVRFIRRLPRFALFPSLEVLRAKESNRYHDKEQSPASSFRLATWWPSTSGGGTSSRSAIIATPSGGTPSEPSSTWKCPEEPVSSCSSVNRTLLISACRRQQRSRPPQLDEDGSPRLVFTQPYPGYRYGGHASRNLHGGTDCEEAIPPRG